MNDIICPHCKKVFKVDEAGFADILKQVRDHVFDKELHERLDLAEKEKENAVKLAKADVEKQMQADIAKKDSELVRLEVEKESAVKLAEANTKRELQVDIAKRDAEIAELKTEKDALLAKTLAEKEIEITKIQAKLESSEADKNAEIAKLQAKLEASDTDKKLAVTEAVSKAEKERDELSAKLGSSATEKELAVSKAVNIVEKQRDELTGELKTNNERHEAELKLKDEQIAQYKDFKSKQSIKLLGESLEQHCEIAFRQWQSAGAFRNVYFEKDNDASTGGKGDYIYRETDEAGNEILSIMFDMKNEADDTTTKKKNEDYFKKLDRDRIEKKCQYAVLVSVLEVESELYTGITDVSYAYDKMYVVRPQFFVPIITLLRNGALDSLKYKAELAVVRNQNIDITNFENDLHAFQDGFMRNVKDSSNKFLDAMEGIDATIKKLEGIKEALRLSNKHLLSAGNKVESVSVKRLTKNSPTMAAKFEELSHNE